MIGNRCESDRRDNLSIVAGDERHADFAFTCQAGGRLNGFESRVSVSDDLRVGETKGAGECEQVRRVSLNLDGLKVQWLLLGLVGRFICYVGSTEKAGELHRCVLERDDIGLVENKALVKSWGGKKRD